MTELYQIDALAHKTSYVAGVVVKDGIVIESAGIVAWAIGKPFSELRSYCESKRFKVAFVAQET